MPLPLMYHKKAKTESGEHFGFLERHVENLSHYVIMKSDDREDIEI